MFTKMQMSWTNGNISLDDSGSTETAALLSLSFVLSVYISVLLFCFGPNFPIDFANGTLPNWKTSPHLDDYHFFFHFCQIEKTTKNHLNEVTHVETLPSPPSPLTIAPDVNLQLSIVIFLHRRFCLGQDQRSSVSGNDKQACLSQHAVKCSYFIIR